MFWTGRTLRPGWPIVKRNAQRRIRATAEAVRLRQSIVKERSRMLRNTAPGKLIGASYAIVNSTMRPSVPGREVNRAFLRRRTLARKSRPRNRTPQLLWNLRRTEIAFKKLIIQLTPRLTKTPSLPRLIWEASLSFQGHRAKLYLTREPRPI